MGKRGISIVVTRGEPQEIEFDAKGVGIFPVKCQLHPPTSVGIWWCASGDAGEGKVVGYGLRAKTPLILSRSP